MNDEPLSEKSADQTARRAASSGHSGGHDLFLSYARRDESRVQAIAAELAKLGYTSFFAATSIRPGEGLRDVIRANVLAARAMLAMITESYVESDFGTLELEWAYGHRTPIIPVLLDRVDPELIPGALRSRQWLMIDELSPAEAAIAIAHALRSIEVQPSSGSAIAPEALAARLTVDTAVLPDLPAEHDTLGFRPLVEGLSSLLEDDRTQLPLSIAVTAPWGAGKSSVMLQLRMALTPSKWLSAYFGAWLYERRERLWAALATAIYEQPQSGMSASQKFQFRMSLERERLGRWRFVSRLIVPPVVAAGALAGAVTSSGVATTLPLGGLAAIATVFALWQATSNAYTRSLSRYEQRPDYRGQLGFTEDARRDIDSLLNVLTRNGTKLAVFVDDLDRLSSAHVVEVVETINQMFNGHEHPHQCLFVLGFDREVVAASIEVAYAETVRRLEKSRTVLAQSFGFDFLSKLVQLSIAIPEPSPEAMERLLGRPADDVSVSHGSTTHSGTGSGSGESRSRATSVGTDTSERTADVLSAVSSSPEVVKAEMESLRHLPRNPRQVKRFCNAFRLQLYVILSGPLGQQGIADEQLAAIGKWVAVRLRWPALAEAVDDEPRLLAILEQAANGEPEVDPELAAVLRGEYEQWFADRRVSQVLHEPDKARRVATLPFESFLRVA